MTDTIETMESFEVLERAEMIRICDLTKRYGEVCALNSFSLSVPKGGLHGVLGPRGAGKSTLLSILSGTVAADGGTVTVGDREVCRTATEVKAKIGYMPEESAFYEDMTVLETLNFVGEARGVSADKRYRQMKEAMELVELSELKNRLVGRLTEGQLKRLGLAASLLGNPDVLLLDEPMPKVGTEERNAIRDLLRMLGKIKTVIIATADFRTVRALCEDVVILSDGKTLAKGTFEALEAKLTESGETSTLEEIYRMLTAASGAPETKEFAESDAPDDSDRPDPSDEINETDETDRKEDEE